MRREIILHLATAIELIGSSQTPTLHSAEDAVRIYQTGLGEVKVHARTKELLGKHGNIKKV